jgi:hypothetical protein
MSQAGRRTQRSNWSPALFLIAGFLTALVIFRLADLYGYMPNLPDWPPPE